MSSKTEKFMKILRGSHKKMSKSQLTFLWLLVIPVFLLYIFICVAPICTSLIESFYGGSQIGQRVPLEHFYDNYAELFGDSLFWNSLKNDLIIILFKEVIIIAIVVFFSISMTRLKLTAGEKKIYRYVFYIPNILSVIVITQFWGTFFQAGGIFNSLFGIEKDIMTHNPLSIVIYIACWCGIGYYMLIMISAIENVPKEMFEAASIDGAGQMRQLFSVTLPQIKPQIIFLAVNIISTSLAANMNIILPLNAGGAQKQSFVMGMFVYYYGKSATTEVRLGYANAGAIILMIISFILCFIVNKVLTKEGDNR